ncbi:MAG: glycosyltransferase [Methanobacterium sp. Maddingley MBC34]|nr:MAG: glycosyltransferase [Methanobacterium sp. Maddingley MBC34]
MHKPNQRYCDQENDNDDLNIIRFKNISDSFAWKYKLYMSPGMIKYLKNNLHQYDVVHLQDLISFASVATSIYCKKYNVPYVLTSHGSLPWFISKKILNRFFYNIFGRNILQNASMVTALNKTEKESYLKLKVAPEKIQIIPNGIDLSTYKVLPKKGGFRNRYLIRNDKRIILYLGRLHESKRIDMLIESFYLLYNMMNNVKLVIVGPDDGFMENLVKKAANLGIGEDVIFTGPLDGINKIEAYVDADIFVTPSFSGFPLTFLESCICGTPIITTNKVEELDWIDGKVGCVVDYDKNQIKNSMFHLLKDEKLLNGLSQNCVKHIEENFGWEQIAQNVEKIYMDICEKCNIKT